MMARVDALELALRFLDVLRRQTQALDRLITELKLIAPRLDAYERATEFMASVAEVEDSLSSLTELSDLYEQLESKSIARTLAHLDHATDEEEDDAS